MNQPNVLFIVSEDNGPELGCYGDRFARTPTLDRLAGGGVRFENAFVPFSVCSPSRACFLTGLYPHQNGQIGLATHKFAMFREFPNIVSMLERGGYRTGNIGKLHINPESAVPYDFWPFKGANFGRRNMREYSDAAAAFFRQSEQPFYLQVNFPDAHFPLHRQQFGLPEQPQTAADVEPLPWVGANSPRLREFTADYYNCLARLDTGVRYVLEELDEAGKTDNTLVIYIGDHGAQFSRGKCSVYEAALRIPLIVSWPGHAQPGTVPKQLVSTIDILPTVLRAAGLETPAELPGIPLQDMMNGEDAPGHEFIAGFTTGAAPALGFLQFSIRDSRWKLIHSPPQATRLNRFAECYLKQYNVHFAAGTTAEEIAASPEWVQRIYATFREPPEYELYDLENDPYEFRNLAEAPSHADDLRRMIKALEAWHEQTRNPLGRAGNVKRFTEENESLVGRNYREDAEFRWEYLDYLRPQA